MLGRSSEVGGTAQMDTDSSWLKSLVSSISGIDGEEYSGSQYFSTSSWEMYNIQKPLAAIRLSVQIGTYWTSTACSSVFVCFSR